MFVSDVIAMLIQKFILYENKQNIADNFKCYVRCN